jgi:hypothetical protein
MTRERHISLSVGEQVEPVAQLVSLLLDLLNDPLFDILPLESQAAALEYVATIRGSSNRLSADRRFQEIDHNKTYLLFADKDINVSDVVNINDRGFKINVVRVG